MVAVWNKNAMQGDGKPQSYQGSSACLHRAAKLMAKAEKDGIMNDI